MITLLDRFEFDAGVRWIPLPRRHFFSWRQWAFDLYWNTHTCLEAYDPASAPTKVYITYFALCVLGIDVGFAALYRSNKGF